MGAAVILATSRSSTVNAAQCLGKLSLASFWCLRETPAAWAMLFALALFFTCLVSDLRLGSSRSAFRARCVNFCASVRHFTPCRFLDGEFYTNHPNKQYFISITHRAIVKVVSDVLQVSLEEAGEKHR